MATTDTPAPTPETTDTPTATEPRSRRSLLAGAAGGAAALVALLTRPARAQAAAGDALIVGSETNNAGTNNTQLIANSNVVTFKLYQTGPGTALMGYTTTASGTTRGVYGRVDSPNGDGVQGRNAGALGTGAAVRGYGGNNDGVVGSTDEENKAGVVGINTGATGDGAAIRAVGGNNIGLLATSEVSNAIYASGAPNGAAAVYAESSANPGNAIIGTASGELSAAVYGNASHGTGVNYGVYGDTASPNGYGVFSGPPMGTDSFLQMKEITEPATPAADAARVFLRAGAGGKTEACVKFDSGAIVVFATQP